MLQWELFNLIKSTKYETTGNAVDYAVVTDDAEKTIYLLFQQSNGSTDWKNNFNFPMKPYKQATKILWYHGGYCKAWKSANDVVMNELKEAYAAHEGYRIVVSGWSLGGAMAVMAAEETYYRLHTKPVLITYGAPKVLWGLTTAINVQVSVKAAYQYANRNDIVPYQPPFMGYRHCGRISVGDRFSLIKIFKPQIYHTIYGHEDLYE